MGEAKPPLTPRTSGTKLALAIVVIGLTAAITALFFRQFTPREVPATQASSDSAGS